MVNKTKKESVTPSNGTEQGIGVQLTVEPGQIRRFLNDLPPRLGEAFTPQDVHATIMYPEELAAAALGAHEKSQIPQVLHKISRGIRQLDVVGKEVMVVPQTLWPFKKFLALRLADDELFDDVRTMAADVIKQEMGISLGGQLRQYHASVARRPRSSGTKKPIHYKKPTPTSLTIAGFNILERTVFNNGRQPQKYTNQGYYPDAARRFS